MKKIAIMAVLAASVMSASAAEFTAYGTYDYDNLERANGVFMHRGTVGLKAGFGALGAVDVAAVGGRVFAAGGNYGDQGIEVGYSNGLKVGKFGLSGRIAAARLNESRADVLRVSTEGTYPVTATISAVAGMEHVRVEGDAAANRFILGADYALTKNVAIRAAYARTNIVGTGRDANGLTTTVSYKF